MYRRTSTAPSADDGFSETADDDMRAIFDIKSLRERLALSCILMEPTFADRAEQDATAKLAAHGVSCRRIDMKGDLGYSSSSRAHGRTKQTNLCATQ